MTVSDLDSASQTLGNSEPEPGVRSHSPELIRHQLRILTEVDSPTGSESQLTSEVTSEEQGLSTKLYSELPRSDSDWDSDKASAR